MRTRRSAINIPLFTCTPYTRCSWMIMVSAVTTKLIVSCGTDHSVQSTRVWYSPRPRLMPVGSGIGLPFGQNWSKKTCTNTGDVKSGDSLETILLCFDLGISLVTWCLGVVLDLEVIVSVITARLMKKIDSVSHLRCLKCLKRDNLVLFAYFTFLSCVSVNIHVVISGTGVTPAGLYASCRPYFLDISWFWGGSLGISFGLRWHWLVDIID